MYILKSAESLAMIAARGIFDMKIDSTASEKRSLGRANIIFHIFIGLCVSIIVFAIYLAIVIHYIPKPEQRGLFGDQFGGLNTLFTGTALVSMVVSLALQRNEIKEQRESTDRQIKEQRESISKQIEEERESANLLRRSENQDRLLISIYKEWHTKDMTEASNLIIRSLEGISPTCVPALFEHERINFKDYWSTAKMRPELAENFERVTSFFDRCAKLKNADLIDFQKFAMLFSVDIRGWHEKFLFFTKSEYNHWLDAHRRDNVIPDICQMMSEGIKISETQFCNICTPRHKK